MTWGDFILNGGAQYERKLPQLGNDDGQIRTPRDVDQWMATWRTSVDEAVEEVEEIGVDRCIAALEQMGVIVQQREWDDDL